MKTVLICPSARIGVKSLSENQPLATIPTIGLSLLEYWLAYLAGSGAKEVIVLASDRPNRVSNLVGNGARWGLHAKVVAETTELTEEEVALKYEADLVANGAPGRIVTLDHFPGQPDLPLFSSYGDWFVGVQSWLPHARTPERIGMREFAPGVWLGLNARVSPAARLQPPCWIGRSVFVGPGAIIGPNAFLEEGSVAEAQTQIASSYIGPHTMVGRYADVANSISYGSTLINWKTGQVLEVHEKFILCSLKPQRANGTTGWFTRVASLYAKRANNVTAIPDSPEQ